MFCSDCAESMSDTLSVINTRASAFDRPCVYQSAAAAAQHSSPPQRQKTLSRRGTKAVGERGRARASVPRRGRRSGAARRNASAGGEAAAGKGAASPARKGGTAQAEASEGTEAPANASGTDKEGRAKQRPNEAADHSSARDKGRQGGTGKPPGQKRACPNGGKRGRPTAQSPSARFWRGGNLHLLLITPSQKAQGARQRLAMPLRFLRWRDICKSWGKRRRGDVSRDDGRARPPPAAAGGRPWRGG